MPSFFIIASYSILWASFFLFCIVFNFTYCFYEAASVVSHIIFFNSRINFLPYIWGLQLVNASISKIFGADYYNDDF